MSVSALLCALLLGLAASSHGMTWEPCTEDDKNIKAVALTPEAPRPGDTVKFTIDATSGIAVSAGTLDIAVTYRGLPVWSESDDLCEKTECPISKGPVTIAWSVDFPIITPPGPYVVQLTAADTSGDQLLCIIVNFDVVPAASNAARSSAAQPEEPLAALSGAQVALQRAFTKALAVVRIQSGKDGQAQAGGESDAQAGVGTVGLQRMSQDQLSGRLQAVRVALNTFAAGAQENLQGFYHTHRHA